MFCISRLKVCVLILVLMEATVIVTAGDKPENLTDEDYDDDDLGKTDWKETDELQNYRIDNVVYRKLFREFIYNGKMPSDQQYNKYMVSIRTSHPAQYFGDNHFCAGVIIATKLVLTTAHCVVDPEKMVTRPARLIVVAGTSNRLRRDKTTIEMKVTEVIPHKKFRRYGSHDIAILKLDKGVPLDNEGVKIMPLTANTDYLDRTNYTFTTLGWGQMYADGPFSADLLEAKYRIVDSHQCAPFIKTRCLASIICGHYLESNLNEACKGDSGGPLIYNDVLIGLVSQSAGCGTSFPTIFTDIYSHRKWIESISSGAGRDGVLITVVLLLLHVVIQGY